MSDNMVKEEPRGSLRGVIKCGHCFGPFGKVVNHNDNVFVSITGGGVTLHEDNALFRE